MLASYSRRSAGAMAGDLVFGIVIAVLVLFSVVFWVMMLVDVARRDFAKSDEKMVWVLIIVLAGIIGALIYYFMVKRPAGRPKIS